MLFLRPCFLLLCQKLDMFQDLKLGRWAPSRYFLFSLWHPRVWSFSISRRLARTISWGWDSLWSSWMPEYRVRFRTMILPAACEYGQRKCKFEVRTDCCLLFYQAPIDESPIYYRTTTTTSINLSWTWHISNNIISHITTFEVRIFTWVKYSTW